MKKIFIIIVLLLFFVLVGKEYWDDFALFGFEKTSSKTAVFLENTSKKTISGHIKITISTETPVFDFFIKAGEKKELIIDWDKVREKNSWGEGNIWLIINSQEEKEVKLFIGEIELYEDGRNYIKSLKNRVEIIEASDGSVKLVD